MGHGGGRSGDADVVGWPDGVDPVVVDVVDEVVPDWSLSVVVPAGGGQAATKSRTDDRVALMRKG